MMERKKKLDDEMLITHKPRVAKHKAGRGVRERALAKAIEGADFGRLREIVAETEDPGERARIIEMIQRRIGNEAANRVIEAVREDGPEED